MPSTAVNAGSQPRARPYRWEGLDDSSLLELRFRDLRLRVKHSPVWRDVEQLYRELERRGIDFRPHVWLSTDWFSPDGIPGIAIPFFVAHPRLRRLEQHMVGEVEGGNRKLRLRILRHEAGHALDTAYGLRRRADWRAMFGFASSPYPHRYRVRPASRRHVLHLGCWYAQSHPTEDFAETFAVWLGPKARWRREYADWPALAKLEYVDALMSEVAGRRPRQNDRSVVAPLADNSRTIKEHYRRRGAFYAESDRRYDKWLEEAFSPTGARRARSVARYLREVKPELRRALVKQTLAGPYLVDHVIDAATARARQLDLAVAGARRDAKRQATQLLEQIIFDVLHRNRESYSL